MKSAESYALAFDVGTTTIAASLVDRIRGERLAAAGCLNPQRRFGADVVARLDAALKSDDDRTNMGRVVNEAFESLAEELCAKAGIPPARVTTTAIAANTVIQHLILGLPIDRLAFPPYRPVSPLGRSLRTGELGWSRDMDCYLFPMPGGYVGGDLVAFLFGMLADGGECAPTLYLDLGTNGEIALTAGEKIFATSAAAGPAFEGGNLGCGMIALSGAIERVSLTAGSPRLSVIGGVSPLGLCGSGALAALAALLDHGVVDHTGRLLHPAEIPSNLANQVQERAGELVFTLYRDAKSWVYLGQNDIRQIQLAKSAIATGIEVLLGRAGLKKIDLKQVVLTGSFGAVLSPQDLKSIGIFSENMVEICRFVREGALAGVEAVLHATDGFASLDRLSEVITVIPLSGTPAFEKNFFEHMNFPKL